jgi:hypothetical protein
MPGADHEGSYIAAEGFPCHHPRPEEVPTFARVGLPELLLADGAPNRRRTSEEWSTNSPELFVLTL